MADKEKLGPKIWAGAILMLIGAAGVSWLICNLLVWGICFCFNLTYTTMLGTGIWLVIIFAISIAKALRGDK